MFGDYRIGAVLLMGGEGRRFGSEVPKQFHLLDGKPVYRYALETLAASGFFQEIVLVCHPDWMEEAKETGFRCVAGGKTRQESSYLGLKGFLKKPDIALIHDAVRPFVTASILRENIQAAIAWGAADTCIPSADTVVYAPDAKEGRFIAHVPKREEVWRGQTPQTFRFDWILEAHEKAAHDGVENASDDCQLILKAGRRVRVVEGDEKNGKITSALDLMFAEQILSNLLAFKGRSQLKSCL